MKIKYGNTDITSKVLEYTRRGNINDDTVFLLGNTPSYQIDIKLDNEDKDLQQMNGNIFEYDDYDNLKGTYFVYEKPEKYTDVVSITAFDFMLLANIPYNSKLEYPVTIKDQLDEIESITGLSILYNNLPAEILEQEVNWYDNTIACRNYLGWIAEISGMNVFAANDGSIQFKTLSFEFDYETEDIDSYEVDDDFIVSKIKFDNGLLVLEQGNDDGNTLYLSSNNPYIDTLHDPTERIYKLYNGLSFTSVKNLKIGGLDYLMLFDVIEYLDYQFLCLDLKSTYKGGEYQIQEVSGVLDSKNADKVTNKYDTAIRIKKIEVILDQNNQSLNIIAKNVEDVSEKVDNIKIGGRNLIHNAKTMVYHQYGIKGSIEYLIYLVDESGNILTDSQNNLLTV